MTTALPCPFCGHHKELCFTEGSTFRWLAYSCRGCGVGNETRKQTMGDGTSEEWVEQAKIDAVTEWNTRTPPIVQPEQTAWEIEAESAAHQAQMARDDDYITQVSTKETP